MSEQKINLQKLTSKNRLILNKFEVNDKDHENCRIQLLAVVTFHKLNRKKMTMIQSTYV